MSVDPQLASVLEEILTLSTAAQLSGLAAHTLAQQADRGKLRARKIGRTWVTTRQWLDEYLATHSRAARGEHASGRTRRRGRRVSGETDPC
jgi:hypothetical protein